MADFQSLHASLQLCTLTFFETIESA